MSDHCSQQTYSLDFLLSRRPYDYLPRRARRSIFVFHIWRRTITATTCNKSLNCPGIGQFPAINMQSVANIICVCVEALRICLATLELFKITYTALCLSTAILRANFIHRSDCMAPHHKQTAPLATSSTTGLSSCVESHAHTYSFHCVCASPRAHYNPRRCVDQTTLESFNVPHTLAHYSTSQRGIVPTSHSQCAYPAKCHSLTKTNTMMINGNDSSLSCSSVATAPTHEASNPAMHLKCGLINARSICNKCDEIVEHITSNKLDVLFLTETWLTGNAISDNAILTNCSPTHYLTLNHPRTDRRGGGIAVLYRKSINLHLKGSQFVSVTFEKNVSDYI
jgi:hypothetical protein